MAESDGRPLVGKIVEVPAKKEEKERFHCNARTKSCRACGHRYLKDEYEYVTCPECGESRLCQQPVREDGLRCRLHGGATPKGIASPHFIHGRHSKYLPDRMIPRYEEAIEDPRLFSLRDDLALLDARLADLLIRVDTGEAGHYWDELREVWQRYERWTMMEDEGEMQAALFDLGRIIEEGRTDIIAWREISDILEQRRKIIDSHRRQLVDLHQMISVERTMTLMGGILGVIRENVESQDVRSAIGDGIRRLVSSTTR